MSSPGALPPRLVSEVPGPRSRALAERLVRVESRNVTSVLPTAPIFWERAQGANVWDVDGNRYVDLTAGFGVANTGHAHPEVVRAVADQAERLLHGLGDVHPAPVKVELLEAIARLYPGGGEVRSVLGSSGSDAVEVALETAALATGRPGVIAFDGAYHGLSLGALDVTARPLFRAPFAARLAGLSAFARFGDVRSVEQAARECRAPVGAVIVEPIQGRGGERIPPRGFLAELRALCDREGWLLIVDEIYTGFGRTGRWFACQHEDVVPDLLCIAKGLAGGMPISACAGRATVMDAWPPSGGEALRTQTFLGHPPGCAAALASIRAIETQGLVARAARLGGEVLTQLERALGGRLGVKDVRGLGLLLAVELESPELAAALCVGALERGVIALLSGDDARVVSLTPPLTIDADQLADAVERVADAMP